MAGDKEKKEMTGGLGRGGVDGTDTSLPTPTPVCVHTQQSRGQVGSMTTPRPENIAGEHVPRRG